MNKTELKKAKIKAALTFLEQNYGAIPEAGGGSNFYLYLTHQGEEFSGQFSRRDFTVTFYDSTTLAGNGWTAQERKHQANAVQLENEINQKLEAIVESIG